MLSVIYLLSISCIIGYSFGTCLETTQANGLASIISYRLFTNGSLAILDSKRQYWIFDSSGAVVWKEGLLLRDSLSTLRPPIVMGATISETGDIHLLTKDKLSYMYSKGRASKPYTSSAVDANFKDAKQINGIQGCVLFHDLLGFRLFQVFADGLKDDVGLADQTCESATNIGQEYVSRISANSLLNEYYVTAKTNTLVIGKVFAAANGFLRIQPSTSELSAFTFTHNIGVAPDANQIISSSVGANQYFFAYAGFFNAAQLNDATIARQVDHKLVLMLRSDRSVYVEKIIYGFYIHSIALHPVNNVIYLYSNRGEMYKQEFTYSSGVLSFTTLTQLSRGLFAKYVEMEVISSSLLVLKNSLSLATYDMSTEGPDLKITYEVKPQWSRHVVGQNFMFLIYHCQYALIFDTTTHTVQGVFKTAKIREIIISNALAEATYFHVLTDQSIEVYTTASLLLTVSKTFAQIQADITAVYPTLDTMYDIVDMERVKVYSGQVVLLIRAKLTSGSEGMLVVFMTELLSPVGPSAIYFITTRIAYYGILTNPDLSPQLTLNLIGANVRYIIYWNSVLFTSPVNPPGTFIPANGPSEGITCSMGYQKICSKFPYQILAKSTEVVDVSAIKYTSMVEPQRHSIIGGYSRSFLINPSSGWTLTDRMLGNFKGKSSIISSENQLIKLLLSWTTFTTSSSKLTSMDSIFGIPYQTVDDSLYITAGHSYHIKVNKPSCFNSGSNPIENIFVKSCTTITPYCLSCNFVDEKCEVCITGYVLSPTQTCILETCSSEQQFRSSPPNSLCVKTCPIEQYKYVSPTAPTGENLCVTADDCIATYNYRTFGDRCVPEVCPAGTTDVASHCVLSLPTNAFNDATPTIETICPLGKKYWEHFKQCTDPAKLPTVNYQQTASIIYCDSSTHYFDYTSRSCTLSCSGYIGFDPTVGKYCVSATDCTSGTVWNNYLERTLSPFECVTDCASRSLWKHVQASECVVECPLNTFKQQSTLSCLTKAECTALSWMTYPSLSTCVAVAQCDATFYWDPTNSQCLTASECIGQNYLLSTNPLQCLASCPANTYLHAPTNTCLTSSQCLSIASVQLIQAAPSICFQVQDCLQQGKKIISSSKVCQLACDASLYLEQTSSYCYTTTECNSLGLFTLDLNSSCIEACPSSAKYQQNGKCVSSCAATEYIEEFNNTCVSQCRYHTSADNSRCLRYLDFADADCIYDVSTKSMDISIAVFFEDTPTQPISSIQNPQAFIDKICTGYSPDISSAKYCTAGALLSVDFVNATLRVNGWQPIEVEAPLAFISTSLLDNIFVDKYRVLTMNREVECKIKRRDLTKIQDSSAMNKSAKVIATTFEATRAALPFLIATTLDPATGGMLCLVAQTYTKLVMMSYLNFDLKNNTFSLLYYSLFHSYFDDYNEKLTASIFGWNIINLNKAYVCKAGYGKFCELTVEDSFFIGHLTEFLVLSSEVLLVLLIKGIFKVTKFRRGVEHMETKSKKKMVFAFLFENGISIWFSLILGSHLPRFDNLVLGILKGGGLLLLLACLWSAALIMVRQTSIERWSQKSSSRVRALVFRGYTWTIDGIASIFEDITLEGCERTAGRFFLLHDLVIGAILVPAFHTGKVQIWLWVVGETAVLYLLARKQIYRSKMLLARQMIIETEFLLLSIILAVFKTIGSNHLTFSKTIFSISIVILGTDSFFVFFAISAKVVNKVRGTNKQAEVLASKSSLRKKTRSKTTKNTLTPGNRLVSFFQADGRGDMSPQNQSALIKKSSWMKGEESPSWDKNTLGNSTATRPRHLKSSTILENVDSPLNPRAAQPAMIKIPNVRKATSRFTFINEKKPALMAPQSATVRMRLKVKTELGSPTNILKKLKTSRDSML